MDQKIQEMVKEFIKKDNAYFYKFVAIMSLLAIVGVTLAPIMGNYLATK